MFEGERGEGEGGCDVDVRCEVVAEAVLEGFDGRVFVVAESEDGPGERVGGGGGGESSAEVGGSARGDGVSVQAAGAESEEAHGGEVGMRGEGDAEGFGVAGVPAAGGTGAVEHHGGGAREARRGPAPRAVRDDGERGGRDPTDGALDPGPAVAGGIKFHLAVEPVEFPAPEPVSFAAFDCVEPGEGALRGVVAGCVREGEEGERGGVDVGDGGGEGIGPGAVGELGGEEVAGVRAVVAQGEGAEGEVLDGARLLGAEGCEDLLVGGHGFGVCGKKRPAW